MKGVKIGLVEGVVLLFCMGALSTFIGAVPSMILILAVILLNQYLLKRNNPSNAEKEGS